MFAALGLNWTQVLELEFVRSEQAYILRGCTRISSCILRIAAVKHTTDYGPCIVEEIVRIVPISISRNGPGRRADAIAHTHTHTHTHHTGIAATGTVGRF